MRDQLIHVLSIKGFAREEILAKALGLGVAELESMAESLTQEGLLENSRIGLKLTEKARLLLPKSRRTSEKRRIWRLWKLFIWNSRQSIKITKRVLALGRSKR